MSAKNGPRIVYHVKPIYDSQMHVELPTCMYNLKSVHNSDSGSEDNKQLVSNDDAEKVLERLSNTLERLGAIKSEAAVLKKKYKIFPKKETLPKPVKDEPIDFKPQEIVVKASPENPPYSIWVFFFFLRDKYKAQLVTYMHSSLKSLPPKLKRLNRTRNDGKYDVTVTIIWKDTGKNPEMVVDPIHQGLIETEINLARYFSRLLSPGYDSDPYQAFEIDYWLELAHLSLVHGSCKDHEYALKTLDSHLVDKEFLVGYSLSVADVVMWSTLLQCRLQNSLPTNVTKWWRNLMDIDLFEDIAATAK